MCLRHNAELLSIDLSCSQDSPVAIYAGDSVVVSQVQQCCKICLAGLLGDLALLLQGLPPCCRSCEGQRVMRTASLVKDTTQLLLCLCCRTFGKSSTQLRRQ